MKFCKHCGAEEDSLKADEACLEFDNSDMIPLTRQEILEFATVREDHDFQ